MTRPAGRRPINTVAGATARSWAWLTSAALVVALAAVVARATTPEVLRDAWAAAPGGDPSHGPGPATGLAMDLVAAVPALLVLARRAVDRDYRLVPRRSHLALLGLTLWMAASVAWSSDRFAAVVSAAHFAAGGCLLWAASQVVRSWDRLRVCAAVALGLLVALAVHTAYYRAVDLADTRRYWAEYHQRFLDEHGWAADSFAAKQFELKLASGEQAAFFASANTLAAVGVLLTFAAAGLGVQHALADRDARWLALTGLAAAAGGWVLWVARSKTSVATPVVGVGVLAAYAAFGPQVRRNARAAYWAAVGGVAVTVAGVVGLGLLRHGLFPGHFGNSLDFRWKYWTASAAVVRDHPLLGVGWGNFGQSYLAHRVPDAAEEIKDPHNFGVRFTSELGIVGLALAVAWLLRLAWELTRPATAPLPPAGRPAGGGTLAAVAGLGIGLTVAATLDTSGGVIDAVAGVLRPLLLALAVGAGGLVGAMRSPDDLSADDRPGRWVYATLVVGLGLFLLHNAIDFAWFESGAAFAFMTLAGAALGMSPAPVPGPARPRAVAVVGLATAAVAWAAVAFGVFVPVALAGQSAASGDDVIRAAPPKDAAADAAAYRRAADAYAAAADLVPYDADLWTRAGRAALAGGDGGRARQWAAAAVAADPKLIDAHLLDAELRLRGGDAAGVRAAYDAVIALDPNDVPIRLHYAKVLDDLGDRPAAAAQYRAALAADDALPAAEPRRLPATDVTRLRRLAAP